MGRALAALAAGRGYSKSRLHIPAMGPAYWDTDEEVVGEAVPLERKDNWDYQSSRRLEQRSK